MRCPECGLKRWDADDLIPGEEVCMGDDEFFCGDPDCTCGDEPDDDGPQVETVTTFQEAGLL